MSSEGELERTIAELGKRERFLLALFGADLGKPHEIIATTTQMLAEFLGAERCVYASGGESPDPHAVSVPLQRDGRVVATLTVHVAQPRAWSPSDRELVAIVLSRCWDLLERAQTTHERRAAERALAENRARVEYAARLSGIGFWYCDLPFSELLWDERVKAHFWLPPDARVTIELFYERIHPDDREPTRRAIEQSIEAHSSYDVIYRTVDPATGATRHIRAMGGTAYDAASNPIRFDGVTLDVSQLRENDRRKDEFLAILAHELRNPLAPVRSGIEVLQQGADLETTTRITRMIGRQVEHVVRIVDDLLDASRVTLGKLVLIKARTDLREIIESAVDATRAAFDANGVRLIARLPARPVIVQGDAIRLAQAVANLLSNAAKFSSHAGTVNLELVVDEPFRARLAIVDEGKGIAADLLESVFVMFTQLDVDPGRTHGGLGIGLALAKRLVEMHGGRILATSRGAGLGSTFTIELPLALADASQVAIETPTDQRGGLRVLIVDDNADASEMLGLLLEADGYVVQRAFDGEEGLAAAERFAPDAILLDLGLPDVEGYEVARQLRQIERTPRPLIVAVTGWGDESHRRRTQEAGFDEHLVKPVDRQRLLRILAKHAVSTSGTVGA